MRKVTGTVLSPTTRLPAELKLRRAELRLEKRQLKHDKVLAYVDRGLDLVKPVIGSPVVMFLGAYLFVNYAANKAVAEIDKPGGPGFWQKAAVTAEATALKTAIAGAFVGNAFGGPVGIANIIRTVKG